MAGGYGSVMRPGSTIGFGAVLALSLFLPEAWLFPGTLIAINAIALTGLVVLCGWSGQFSFAQAPLCALGGYVAAILAARTGLGPWAALALAPAAGGALGYALGRVAGGHSLWTQALVSYALTVAFPQFLRWPPIEGLTGGVNGLYLDLLEAPSWTGLADGRWSFLVAASLLAVCLALLANLPATRTGRAIRAVRDHDLAAAAQGIDVAHQRALASGIAGAAFALSGSLMAGQFGYVGPTSYGFAFAVQLLFGAVIGGIHSLWGAVVGALFLQFFPSLTAALGKGLSALLFAVLLVAAIVAMPRGIAGLVERLATRRSSVP